MIPCKKWVLIGVLSSGTNYGNNWVVTTQDFLGQQPQNDFDKTIAYTSGEGVLQWKYDAANGTGTLTQGNTTWDMHGKKGNDLNAGKTSCSPAIMARSFCRIPLIRGAGICSLPAITGCPP